MEPLEIIYPPAKGGEKRCAAKDYEPSATYCLCIVAGAVGRKAPTEVPDAPNSQQAQPAIYLQCCRRVVASYV